MRRVPFILVCIAALGGCEPERGIRADRDYASIVSVDCIDQALHQTFGEVERWDYVSDGDMFSRGTQVAQFAYYNTNDAAGWATVKVGSIRSGTRIVHDFTGIGAQLPQSAFPPAMEAMERANSAMSALCELDLSGMKMQEIGQDVDALD